MNLRTRVLAALDFQEPDALPYTLPMEEEVAARLDAHLGSPAWRSQVQDHIANVRLPGLSVPEGIRPTYTDPFGITWRTDKRPYHLQKPALPEPDLGGYVWPRVEDLWDETLARGQVEEARARGQFVVASTGFGLFERTWTLRGFENALMDMLLHPVFYETLLDRILDLYRQLIRRWAALPIDAIMLSDDWSDQRGILMGPGLWRQFIKPRAEQFFAAVHTGGKWTVQHCCGNIAPLVPEMIEIGLDVLESLQSEAMDIYALKRDHGRDLRLWGGLGTQQLLPFGTPAEIRAEVARLREHMGRGGGYILAPSKPLLPEVPTENALAALQAFGII